MRHRAGIGGFAETHGASAVTGFDADLCRAVASAIVGSADAVRFKQATSLEEFLAAPEIDLVSRRLTWTLERESSFDVSFGPVVFYDGQGFLVRTRLKGKHTADLAGLAICVDPGTAAERRLSVYFRQRNIAFVKHPPRASQRSKGNSNPAKVTRTPRTSPNSCQFFPACELGRISPCLLIRSRRNRLHRSCAMTTGAFCRL